MSVKLFARAKFENYKPASNEFQIRVPGIVEVEVFKDTAETWKARSVQGNGLFKGIEGHYTYVQDCIALRFEKQITNWSWSDAVGTLAESPAELAITHSVGKPHMQKGLVSNVKRTACGKIVQKGRIVPAGRAVCSQCMLIAKKASET
jgi:hypothetical protein